jgi:hypothetical protein
LLAELATRLTRRLIAGTPERRQCGLRFGRRLRAGELDGEQPRTGDPGQRAALDLAGLVVGANDTLEIGRRLRARTLGVRPVRQASASSSSQAARSLSSAAPASCGIASLHASLTAQALRCWAPHARSASGATRAQSAFGEMRGAIHIAAASQL